MQIFELFGSILLKDDGIENKLNKIDKTASKSSSNMDNAFKGFTSTLLKVGAALGIGLGIQGFIDDAAEAESGVSQLNAVLASTKGASGLTAKAVTDIAGALQKVTKFSDDEILSGQNLLLTFTKIGKDVFPMATETMLNMAQALGTDAKGSAIQLGKALNDPIAGISALSRVGVTFTAEQKESIKTMVEHGNVVGAQKVILAELGTEFGNSAKAAGETFAGQLARVKNQFGEVSESIGGKLLPMLSGFLTWTIDKMPFIQNVIGVSLDSIEKGFSIVGNYVKDNLVPIFKSFYDWVVPNIPATKAFIVDMIDIVVPKFKTIVDIVTQIAKTIFPDMKQGSINLKDEVKSLTTTGLDILITSLTWVKDNIPIVQGLIVGLTAVWVTQKGIILAHNIALGAHNVMQGIKMVQDKLETGYIVALYVAQGIQTAATKAGTIAQTAFNLVMSLNPIGLVIIALAALGLAIYAVVKHWQDICEWIGKAWDWLTKWNKTEAKDKNATVTTNYKDTGSGNNIPYNASGTDNWRGGLTYINEVGGEIVDLPSGTRIIPHDVSMEMAKNGSSKGDVYIEKVIIDGSTIKDFNDVVNVFSNLKQAQRAY